MAGARPRVRIDILAQVAALLGLLVVFLLLLRELREEPPAPPAPVAATSSRGGAATGSGSAPVSTGPILQPPPPLETRAPEPAERATAVGSGAPRPGSVGDEKQEKLFRPHIFLDDGRGKAAPGVFLTSRVKKRKLKPKRTLKPGDAFLDLVLAEETPLTFTVRDARWGKQRFVARIRDEDQRFRLETPYRGVVFGTARASDGTPVKATLSLIDSEGAITELDEDVLHGADGSFSARVVLGHYRVRANAPGFCPADWVDTVVMPAGAQTEGLAFTLLRASKISGPLVYHDGNANRTIELEVERPTNAGPVSSTHKVRTDERGTFELKEVRPGWVRIRACDDKHEGPWATVQITEGAPVENCTLSLEGDRRDPAVEGVVRDEAGTPLPLVTVWSRSQRTVSSDDGRFVLRVDPADHETRLVFEMEGFKPASRIVETPRPGEARKGVEIKLESIDDD